MKVEVEITEISQAEIGEILPYVKEFRKELFPMLDETKIPRDLQMFEEKYIQDELGIFLQARNKKNNDLIGVIGMNCYDHRFSYLDYKGKKTVEVARLYVEPAYRRQGIACLLVDTLKKAAEDRLVEVLYLHTHPFLPGAIEFWEKQGFSHSIQTEENGFITNHMYHQLIK